MKYMLFSLSYMRKHCLVYAILAIVPAALLGLYSTPFHTTLYWLDYRGNYIEYFGQMAYLVYDVRIFANVYPAVLIAVSLVVCFCIAYYCMERHMKIGKLSLSGPLTGINFTIIPVIITLFTLAFVLNFVKLIVASVAYIVHQLSTDVLATNTSVALIAILSIIIVILAIVVCISMTMWVPAMLMSGYNFMDMAAFSLRLVQNHFWELILGIVLPLSATVALLLLMYMSRSPTQVLVATRIILYLFWIIYLQVYTMTAYFSLTNSQRVDLKGAKR
jgi:hypothetical protein